MWPESSETKEILNLAKQGDDHAVNQLMERHREAIRRLVNMRMDAAIAQRVDASDIVQDVLIEAHRRLADYLKDPAMPFHLWLRHLARDQIITAHRRHRLAQRRSVDREQPANAPAFDDRSSIELLKILSADGLTPAAAAIRRELQERFNLALVELSDDDREIILMRHFEHLTNHEVALAMDLTEPAASMRYLRAIRRLRALLGSDSEESRPE